MFLSNDYDLHCYKVTAVYYADNESEFSNESCASIPVGIIHNPINDQIVIYPNPTKGELRIENGKWRNSITNYELEITNVEIFDVMGKSVIQLFSYSTSIDISRLPAGIYFIRIQTESGVVVRKVVKQ
jgi:hypothetical protein